MKLFLSLCLFLSACMTPALAASAETDALLQQLTQTKLSKMPAMVQQLEATGDESLLPVFRAWLAGDLHYIRDDNTLVVEVDVNGVDTYQDPYTQATIAGLTSKQVRKIKVNNKLRGLLRGVIARIQLTSRDAGVRESAVRALLADIDDETFATLERIYPTEPNSDVRSMMQTALSIYTAQDQNSSQSARLAAIDVLGDSLENDVRNVLLSLERSDNP
ncbi:MAG: urea ABC transporter permease subunit UrtB, partial [Marinomonas gallaica]